MALKVKKMRKHVGYVIIGRIHDQWWFGPYDTKQDAQLDADGMTRCIETMLNGDWTGGNHAAPQE